jgi:hypothetical protein
MEWFADRSDQKSHSDRTRNLRSAAWAGARTKIVRKKKPATSVGMTAEKELVGNHV